MTEKKRRLSKEKPSPLSHFKLPGTAASHKTGGTTQIPLLSRKIIRYPSIVLSLYKILSFAKQTTRQDSALSSS
ncbi:hypothetical protein, partial [Stomatobaculum longum]|uniref:hypothetical protein n=1 Tax=Stomatobaculum longum TaxID=796942 RepID=UPI0028F12F33